MELRSIAIVNASDKTAKHRMIRFGYTLREKGQKGLLRISLYTTHLQSKMLCIPAIGMSPGTFRTNKMSISLGLAL